MSTAFNMPPGVTPAMIPGNEPESAIDEAVGNAVYELLDAFRIDDTDKDKIVEWVIALRSRAYVEGYTVGQRDTLMLKELGIQL